MAGELEAAQADIAAALTVEPGSEAAKTMAADIQQRIDEAGVELDRLR